MATKNILIIGGLLFLLVAITCIFGSAAKIEKELQEVAQSEIYEFGLTNTEVWFDGRDAILLADVQNKRELYQAAEIVRHIPGVRKVQPKFVINHQAVIEPSNLQNFDSSGALPDARKLYRLYFPANSSGFTTVHFSVLDTIIAISKIYKTARIRIAGFTDDSGEPFQNKILSFQRASSVKNYFTAHGLAPNRLTVLGYGDAHPLDKSNTVAGRERNRRVEIKLIMED